MAGGASSSRSSYTNTTFEHVSDKLLDVDRDCNKFVIALTSIHHKWYQLGTHLNIPIGTLQSIAGKHNNDHFIQMSYLISTWIRRPTPDHHPSRRVLCEALASLGEVSLAMRICENHKDDQSIGRGEDVTIAVMQEPRKVTTELKNLFNELLEFTSKEICQVDIIILRLRISEYFRDEEGHLDEMIELYLAKIDAHYATPNAILNSFIRTNFIGYINYALIKVFQRLVKSPLLDKRIEKYEEKYHSFLKLTFMDYTQVFQWPILRPDYPAGIPKFSFYLGSEWKGRTMISLKEILSYCFSDKSSANIQDWIHQLMIAEIRHNCIIVTFAVLPHIAREVLKYLTNDDVIESMKKEGISVNISEQLMKYITSPKDCHAPQGFEIDHLHNSQAASIITFKRDWDKSGTHRTDSTYGSEVNEDFRLADVAEDLILLEANDAYEEVVDILQKQNKSLESQLVEMKMELNNTRESLEQMTLERDEARGTLVNQFLTHKQIMRDQDNTTATASPSVTSFKTVLLMPPSFTTPPTVTTFSSVTAPLSVTHTHPMSIGVSLGIDASDQLFYRAHFFYKKLAVNHWEFQMVVIKQMDAYIKWIADRFINEEKIMSFGFRFAGPSIQLNFPHKGQLPTGWVITPVTTPCSISKEDVDFMRGIPMCKAAVYAKDDPSTASQIECTVEITGIQGQKSVVIARQKSNTVDQFSADLYRAHFFYKKLSMNHWEFQMVVIKQMDTYIRLIIDQFVSEEKVTSFGFRFSGSSIELKFPDKDQLPTGWVVAPVTMPCSISKKDVDSLSGLSICKAAVYAEDSPSTATQIECTIEITGIQGQKSVVIARQNESSTAASNDSYQSIEQTITDQDFITMKEKANVKEAIQKLYAILKVLFNSNIDAISAELISLGVIPRLKAQMSFDKILTAFYSGMDLCDDVDEVREWCNQLLTAMKNTGGPLKKAAQKLEKTIKLTSV